MDLLCGPVDAVGELGEVGYYPVGFWISSRFHGPAVVDLTFALY